jgi:16S rRNA G966 N2-methylase RsmD
MYDFIRKTAAAFGLAQIRVLKQDVFRFIQQCTDRFDLIFAGPPYALASIDDLPRLVFEKHLLTRAGWFILEHTPRNDYKTFQGYKTERKYGTTIFSIFVETREEPIDA